MKSFLKSFQFFVPSYRVIKSHSTGTSPLSQQPCQPRCPSKLDLFSVFGPYPAKSYLFIYLFMCVLNAGLNGWMVLFSLSHSLGVKDKCHEFWGGYRVQCRQYGLPQVGYLGEWDVACSFHCLHILLYFKQSQARILMSKPGATFSWGNSETSFTYILHPPGNLLWWQSLELFRNGAAELCGPSNGGGRLWLESWYCCYWSWKGYQIWFINGFGRYCRVNNGGDLPVIWGVSCQLSMSPQQTGRWKATLLIMSSVPRLSALSPNILLPSWQRWKLKLEWISS